MQYFLLTTRVTSGAFHFFFSFLTWNGFASAEAVGKAANILAALGCGLVRSRLSEDGLQPDESGFDRE